ncbi:VOC family protein [Massilia sp. PAMC28688]|uniref:VOC family protein n=1 Tax=Massilia sp. PAMC28688 TaxID=2861283 RepID=UPI001C634CD3|nr:VOC family protein [Massilia sp. PAMC28688]QYF94462.1 VOC family protein [Massilia sp. PAMC28688]
MLTGLNHLTLSCTDLDRSMAFYGDVLGFRRCARWDRGAYLSLGQLWLCLATGGARPSAGEGDYTHYALSVEAHQFADFAAQLRAAGVIEWKADTSEGDSIYFLDPDGHRLEVHAGTLQSRLEQCRSAPYSGMQFFD